MSEKYVCTGRRCSWRGALNEWLTAPNPFDPTDTLYGCPACKRVDSIQQACEIDGCFELSTCGTPTKDGGYIRTCGKHMPKVLA